ncbi:MAG: glutamate synthase subunit alpha, partial [Eubacterium sp.]|nr:glutamate synthase subunit alpha [Eubacterium sp.]
IYDMKNANKNARISVKLVSEAGVGTVAAGVAKAGAQVVLVSGYDGGTGAAPLSSIHNAGLPWELGLAETHQTLIANGLRNQVVIETDGKLMSGRDVAIAAILGAEEFGFATAPLVTMGCVMMRECHQDTCPMGIATQNPELRKRFAGKPEHVENFMIYVARQLREYMAKFGVRTVDELVGRTDLLKKKENLSEDEQKIDLGKILYDMSEVERDQVTFNPEYAYDFKLEETMDESVLLKDKGIKESLKSGKRSEITVDITNTDRTFGTLLGAEITRKYPEGLEDDTITVHCNGSGGQSFGAFIPKGLTITIDGDSNDYYGKGLSGGKLVINVPKEAKYNPGENIIIGNVALYGATSGEAYIAGMAGERFCVRNSGALAVVEGVGEHGCEYMTGGCAVILGPTGKNFAAGMSGGVAYVLDEHNKLYKNLNKQLVSMENVEDQGDINELKRIIEQHVKYTGSQKGKEILEHFDEAIKDFKKIIPTDYKEMKRLIAEAKLAGFDDEQAAIEAFKQFN